jgi:hypothetical protein
VAAKKTTNPLAAWPGGANPKTAEGFQKNLTEARKRLDDCMAKKSALWGQVMEGAEDGFLQKIVGFRDQAEKFGQLEIKLGKYIRKWEEGARDFATSELMQEQRRTDSFMVYHNPPPWQQEEAGT